MIQNGSFMFLFKKTTRLTNLNGFRFSTTKLINSDKTIMSRLFKAVNKIEGFLSFMYGRVEDVTIFIRSDKNGQDQECVHQRHSAGGTVGRENSRGKTEMVWTPTEER